MKSLNEVIEAMKCFDPEKECAGCPYEELHHMGAGIGPSCIDMLAQDALFYLKMYYSDKTQWEADRKAYEEDRKQKLAECEAARDKYIAKLKELKDKSGTTTAPWNPDRNRYCCDQCGAYIGKYDKYCNGCGARLTDWTPNGRSTRK